MVIWIAGAKGSTPFATDSEISGLELMAPVEKPYKLNSSTNVNILSNTARRKTICQTIDSEFRDVKDKIHTIKREKETPNSSAQFRKLPHINT